MMASSSRSVTVFLHPWEDLERRASNTVPYTTTIQLLGTLKGDRSTLDVRRGLRIQLSHLFIAELLASRASGVVRFFVYVLCYGT